MSDPKHDHIAQAHAALEAGTADRAGASSDSEALSALSELSSIVGLVGQITAQYRWETAEWATVGAHLEQAQEYATGLTRCLDHARGTLAFNSAVRERHTACAA
jgi:hypothetical protein